MSKYVILRPAWLIEVLRCLLRQHQPSAEDVSTTSGTSGRQSSGQSGRVEKLRTELVKYGMYLYFVVYVSTTLVVFHAGAQYRARNFSKAYNIKLINNGRTPS